MFANVCVCVRARACPLVVLKAELRDRRTVPASPNQWPSSKLQKHVSRTDDVVQRALLRVSSSCLRSHLVSSASRLATFFRSASTMSTQNRSEKSESQMLQRDAISHLFCLRLWSHSSPTLGRHQSCHPHA